MLGCMRNDRRHVSGIHISMCAYEHPDGLMRGVFHRHQPIRVDKHTYSLRAPKSVCLTISRPVPRSSKRSNFERTRTKCFSFVTGRSGASGARWESVVALCKAIT